jgi:hypothetical protein
MLETILEFDAGESQIKSPRGIALENHLLEIIVNPEHSLNQNHPIRLS